MRRNLKYTSWPHMASVQRRWRAAVARHSISHRYINARHLNSLESDFLYRTWEFDISLTTVAPHTNRCYVQSFAYLWPVRMLTLRLGFSHRVDSFSTFPFLFVFLIAPLLSSSECLSIFWITSPTASVIFIYASGIAHPEGCAICGISIRLLAGHWVSYLRCTASMEATERSILQHVCLSFAQHLLPNINYFTVR